MNTLPKVSIIIPVFNGSNYIKESIDSALKQTYKNIEVIVVNDGSSDDGATEKIIRSYGTSIKYLTKSNGGVSSALNYGIKHMTGELFSWLSHDDLYLPEKIAVQVGIFNNALNKDTIIFGGYQELDPQGNALRAINPSDFLSSDELAKSLNPLLRGMIHGCTLLIPKNLFSEIGTFDENQKTTGDYSLWFDFLRKVPLIFDRQINTLSRVHPDQESYTKLHIAECNHLWKGFIRRLTLSEKIYLDGGEYLFLKKMAAHLSQTPYVDAKNFAESERDNYLNRIKVSVILIGIDNQLKLEDLERSINSLINQTHKNFEIIALVSSKDNFKHLKDLCISAQIRNSMEIIETSPDEFVDNLKKCIYASKGMYKSFLKISDTWAKNKITFDILTLESSCSPFNLSMTGFKAVNKSKGIFFLFTYFLDWLIIFLYSKSPYISTLTCNKEVFDGKENLRAEDFLNIFREILFSFRSSENYFIEEKLTFIIQPRKCGLLLFKCIFAIRNTISPAYVERWLK
jgi:glycosyltransferase involved in cell wall biosynthesis